MSPHMRRHRVFVMNRTNGHKPAKKKDPTIGMDDGERIARLMRPFHQALIEDAFLDASDAGVDATFSLDNPYVQTVLDQLAKQVRAVAETTKDEIRMLVGQQAGNGWSNEELAQAIIDAGVTRSATRAMTISRTESGNGYNRGAIAAYRTADVTHVDVLDGDDDPICAAANGARWTLEEAEQNPLGHPNCTRAFSPVVET